MDKAAFLYAILAQLTLFVGLAACVGLKPGYVLGHNEGGVSNYATDRRAVFPYSLAFIGEAVFTLLVIFQLPDNVKDRLPLIALLAVLALLVLLILVSSYVYKRSEALRLFHFICGGALIAFETLFAIWLIIFIGHNIAEYAALVIELIGDALCILSLKNIVQKLFLAQFLANAGFAIILLCSIRTG